MPIESDIVLTGRAWIPAFAGMTGSGNRQLLNRIGITVGYGARNDRIGPELQFGHVIGDYFENQVFLIKTAWGGKSLAKDFRPPQLRRRGRTLLH